MGGMQSIVIFIIIQLLFYVEILVKLEFARILCYILREIWR